MTVRRAASEAAAPLLLGAAAFAVLGGAWAPGLVATGRFNDIGAQFAAWREWGFAELAAGRFPLWSPYAFGGMPFHGSFEPGLLYPPNWLHLILPLEPALNALMALHLWLAGGLSYAWARRRGASREGAALAGAAFMFCGPLLLRLYSGHLPYLLASAWTPLALLAVDELRERPSAGWTAVLAVAGGAAALAGSPQAALNMALAAALYAVAGLPPAGRRGRYALGLATAAAAAAALSAAQWVPGLDAARESTRWAGLGGDAASFALRLRDLPSFFFPSTLAGALASDDPVFYWERCAHLGLVPLLLALDEGRRGRERAALVAAGVLLFLAFGPASRLPLMGMLRAPARLTLPVCALLARLAAHGFDRRAARWTPRSRAAGLAAALLSSAFFAARNVSAESIHREFPPAWDAALAALPPGQRVLLDMRTDPNGGMAMGVSELWGYGQLVPRRWAELLYVSQGLPPASAGANLLVRRRFPLLRLLRAAVVLRRAEPMVLPLEPVLPRLMLVGAWQRATGREDALAAVLAADFDPAAVAVLESDPVPAPTAAGATGSVRLLSESAGELSVEAELPAPALLLVGDGWAPGWRAEPLPGSSGSRYEVLPADHALRAVPLAAGRHRLRLYYAPAGWALALLLSAVAWLALAGMALRRSGAVVLSFKK